MRRQTVPTELRRGDEVAGPVGVGHSSRPGPQRADAEHERVPVGLGPDGDVHHRRVGVGDGLDTVSDGLGQFKGVS